jgi:hypothetical protein
VKPGVTGDSPRAWAKETKGAAATAIAAAKDMNREQPGGAVVGMREWTDMVGNLGRSP